ncbi:MAG: carboxypeptidase regulatory-like domain-containing protein [Acidobacteriota bacterium]|nr:carboxypeptidase regulatory-like domain-containing protein [Blastocatellia bacterium]MDW8412905.1 carboxypeptidase regulatory-like domain-containing protein [Acidobacteriota bacterium]
MRFSIFVVTLLLSSSAFAQQGRSNVLRGQVLDQTGAGISGAELRLIDSAGNSKTMVADERGSFSIAKLAPGEYVLKVEVPGFEPFTSEPLKVGDRPLEPLLIKLVVASTVEQVTIDSTSQLSVSSSSDTSALVFKGKDLEQLPDDPNELQQALQELAGPSAGPNGAQLFVDGFSGLRLPPKSSIREIRINSNPFSAEYAQIGFGRIEILTKPGTDKLRGDASFSFNDESLNARNAFVGFRAPLQVRRYALNLSGPVIRNKASFAFDFERRTQDENANINVTLLDKDLNPAEFSTVILTPQVGTNFGLRFDYQFGTAHTLVSRYSYAEDSNKNQGVGTFELPTRAFDTFSRNQNVYLTLTSIVSPKVVNEARLQLSRTVTTMRDVVNATAVVVNGSFIGGGAQNGQNRQLSERFELQNFVSLSLDKHSVKTGAVLRGGRLSDINTSNFGGTFIFAGDVERDAQGRPLPSARPISSLEHYRRTLLGLPGYYPSQFTIRSGDPFASVNQYELSLFVQDEWRLRQNLSVSAGMRYEVQTNLGARYNFAPRLAIAYSPRSSAGQPSTVIRAGFGIFYDRFNENLTLNARRLDGTRVAQFFAINPKFFPRIPSVSELQAAWPIRQFVAEGMTAPYVMQGVVSFERQLPKRLTLSVNYLWARGVHQLRSRNINAPLPGTFTGQGSGIRPFGNVGEIYLYESTGFTTLHQLRIGLNQRFSRNFSFFTTYALSDGKGDTEGVGTFPANSYDLSGEFGRSAIQVKHFFVTGSSIQLPWRISASPFVIARSGRPFNIVTGVDSNGDSLFTERPSFALPGSSGAITTAFGGFNVNPQPGEQIIPRNFGDGPAFFNVNLSLSRTFGFGGRAAGNVAADQQQSGPPTGMIAVPAGRGLGGPGGRGGGGFRGFGGFADAAVTDSRYNLTVAVRANNLFNRVNETAFAGALTSPFFGRANAAFPARRVELQVRFRF